MNYRFLGLNGAGVEMLLPPTPPATTPATVRDASDHAENMFDEALKARSSLELARSELQQAKSADAAADRAAVAAGKAMPAKRAQEAAQRAVEAAERRHEASQAAWAAAVRAFLVSVAESLPQWLPDQAQETLRCVTDIHNLLAELGTAFEALDTNRAVSSTLEEMSRALPTISGHTASFGRPSRPQARIAEIQAEQAREDVRLADEQRGSMSSWVVRDVPHLLAALETLVTPNPPPQPLVLDEPTSQPYYPERIEAG
jgi:hypothetical protein